MINGIRTAIITADQHYPYYDQKTLEITQKIAKDIKPDYLIFLGDCFDAEHISKFSVKDSEDGVIHTQIEMVGFRDKIYKPLIEACDNKNLIVHYILGNHDGERINKYLYKVEMRKDKDVFKYYRSLLDVHQYFPEAIITPYNKVVSIGRLNFTHGEYHNDAHAKKHILTYGENVMYGHIHATQVYSNGSKATGKIKQGISVPCSCKLEQRYKGNRSTTWFNGLAVVYFMPNGVFYYYILNIINGKTYFNNKLYD